MANQKRTTTAWCSLLLFWLLAVAWIALRMHVRNPMFGSCIFDPSCNSLVYFSQPINFNYVAKPTWATNVDLYTGSVDATLFDQTTLATHHLGDGERLRYHTSQDGIPTGFEIFNKKTGARLIETELREPLNRPVIVGNRYLVGFGINRGSISSLTIIDAYAGDAVANVENIPIQPLPPGLVNLERKPLRGTSQFAVEVRSTHPVTTQTGQDNVVVFEIKDGQTREVARWISGCSPANVVDHDRKLFSLSADAQQIEIRELPSLHLIEERPIPSELAAKWASIQFQDGMGKVGKTATGHVEFFRLPDFKRVEVPADFNFWSPSEDPTRHVLLADRTSRDVHYAVVDQVEGRIIFQQSAGVMSTAALLDEHRLGICDLTSGVSIDLIDLPTGSVIKRLQPYAWLDWWVPFLTLVSLANCVFWIHAAHAAGLPAAVSILTLTTFVGGASLFGCVYYGAAWQVERPCVCYLFVVMTSMMFMSGWYAALGASNWARRWVVLTVSLCVVLQVITFLRLGVKGIREFDSLLAIITLLAIFIVVVPAMTSALLLWAARLMGLSWNREDDSRVSAESRQHIALADYFWLTAASGLLIMSLAPLRAGLWNVDDLFSLRESHEFLFLPLLALIAFPVALFTLSRSRMIQRIMVVLMLLAGVCLVVDVTLLFWYGPVHSDFIDLTLMRMAVAMGFSSYLYFTAWRLERWGLRWRRGKVQPA